jgi:uncharacterized protein involved in exopolysaccharide biosynthesis
MQISKSSGASFSVAFFRAGLSVFLFTVICVATVTALLPYSYFSDCAVIVRQEAAITNNGSNSAPLSVEDVTSEPVLRMVVEELDLNHKWGKTHAADDTMNTTDCVKLLKKRVQVRALRSDGPITSPKFLEVGAFSAEPLEAMEIANAVSSNFIKYCSTLQGNKEITIAKHATLPVRPARPNKMLNNLIGGIVGIILGAGAGAIRGWKAVQKQHNTMVPPILHRALRSNL